MMNEGFDVIVISTANSQQEHFWQSRLAALLGKGLKEETLLLCVSEGWPQGAGNGLGTLDAYEKARRKALELWGIDLLERQREGASIVIYHTAGQGKRLAPLSLSEGDNKAAVLLPAFWDSPTGKSSSSSLTILEAIIKQTAPYAASLKSRLAVFWGDQLFLSSHPLAFRPQAAVELFSIPIAFPSAAEWQAYPLHNYGLIAKDRQGEALLLDKIDYLSFEKMVASKVIDHTRSLAISLGSFALSHSLLVALLDEFAAELKEKKNPMDSDPFFWMPLTLEKELYLRLMGRRQGDSVAPLCHYERMQNFRHNFSKQQAEGLFFGSIDIGEGSFWWDYGSVQSYFLHHLKLLTATPESLLFQKFYSLLQRPSLPHLQCDDSSLLFNCNIKSGNIKNSILIDVDADHVDLSNCLILNSRFKELFARTCLLYNVEEEENLHFEENNVRADLFLPHKTKKTALYSQIGRDGKQDWSLLLPNNPLSYEEISRLIAQS